jgi:osmoprotectant transport system permease protein
MASMVEFLQRYQKDLLEGLVDHVVLTGIAVGVGFLLALGLTLLIVRWRRLETPIVAVTGTLYTIPSLALFALLVPLTGLTLVTAEIGLVSYTLLILVRNMLAGLDGVPGEILEAADGMGHTKLQRLIGVELPLAVPLIVAGLRIATVTTIGLVMVTAVIGEGGLGQVLLRGFTLRHWDLVYGALVAMVALAIVADLVLVGAGRLITPWQRRTGT